MAEQGRRDFLKKLATSPLFFAAAPLSRVLSQQGSANKAKSGFKYLNVILHGLAAVVVEPASFADPTQGIKCKFPEITIPPPHNDYSHAYKFGNLKNVPHHETDDLIQFDPNVTYSLSGILAGNRPTSSAFQAASGGPINVILEIPTISVNGTNRTFVLPWTDVIESVNLMERVDSKRLLTDTSPTAANGSLYWASAIHIFRYDVDPNGNGPQILKNMVPTAWSPVPGMDPQYANLHIFAEPSRLTDSDHARKSFKKLMTLISVGAMTIDKSLAFNKFLAAREIPNVLNPPGTDPKLDLQHLSHFCNCLTERGGDLANCISPILFP